MKTVSRFFPFAAVLAAISLCNCKSLSIIQPVKFVHRADFRSPKVVFTTGLRSIGDNTNMLDHVQGRSCSYGLNPSTAFVATTSNQSFANAWGGDQLWLSSFEIVYVYKIRTTKNFYDCYHSLMRSYRNMRDKTYRSTAEHYKYQKEWLASNGVPPQLIVSAKVYDRDPQNPGKLRYLGLQHHPGYIRRDTVGNSQPFEDHEIGSNGAAMLLVASRLPYLSSCYTSCPSVAGRRLRNGGSSCQTGQIVFESSSEASKATVWDPVDKQARERIVQWEEETVTPAAMHTVEKPKSCNIDTGTENDYAPPLKIDCPRNRFFKRFVVVLSAGFGARKLVHSTHTDGVAGHTWEREDRQILLLESGKLIVDWKYSNVNQVFAGGHESNWWSEIRILPVYPAYHEQLP